MTTYIVKQGDSLWKIAIKFEVGISEIIQANPQIKNSSLIYPGQQLIIPNLFVPNCIEQKVVDLTNQFRQLNGLPIFTVNGQLSRVARLKSEDMRDRDYAEHHSPTYGSPFEMILAYGISYKAAAENVAGGQATPEEAVCAWINESSHRANLLDAQYREIGVGYAQGGTFGYYWTQMFID